MATRTARQVITDCFHRMGLISEDEDITAPQGVRGLSVMNDMMNGFDAESISYVHTDLAMDDTVNVPDSLVRSVMWMLLKELADEYGRTLTASQLFEVGNARSNLQSYYFKVQPAQTDDGILGRRVGLSLVTNLKD
jgi:hypothetical protein